MTSNRSPKWSAILTWVVLVAFLALFTPIFLQYWHEWNRSHSPFGYGYLVPPTVLYLLWCKRKRIKEQEVEPGKWWSLLIIGFCALLLYIAIRTSITIIYSAAFFILLMAIPYYLWGRNVYKTIWGPIAFTATMIPWPDQLTAKVLVPAQVFSAKTATMTLSWFDPAAYLSGTRVELSHYGFDVALACSGLTILFPVIAIAILNMMMVEGSLLRKSIVLLLAFPISMLSNTLRISIIGLIGNSQGSELADRLHDSSGIAGVIIAIVFLTLAQWITKTLHYYSDYMPSFGHPESKESDAATNQEDKA